MGDDGGHNRPHDTLNDSGDHRASQIVITCGRRPRPLALMSHRHVLSWVRIPVPLWGHVDRRGSGNVVGVFAKRRRRPACWHLHSAPHVSAYLCLRLPASSYWFLLAPDVGILERGSDGLYRPVV